MPWVQVVPVVDFRVRRLCFTPYPGHQKGCPNYKKCARCPPKAPLIHHEIDLSREVWAVYNAFDIASHIEKMRAKHPDWSERQLVNCLYWQPGARKQLKAELVKFAKEHRGLVLAATPEAMGVDLTATMAAVGIQLEWPPRKLAYQIVLAGFAQR